MKVYAINAQYFSTFQEELDMSRLQVKQLNDLVSEADEIVKVLKPGCHNFDFEFASKI